MSYIYIYICKNDFSSFYPWTHMTHTWRIIKMKLIVTVRWYWSLWPSVISSGYVCSNEGDSYGNWLSILEIWNRQAFSVSQPAIVISQLILKFKRRWLVRWISKYKKTRHRSVGIQHNSLRRGNKGEKAASYTGKEVLNRTRCFLPWNTDIYLQALKVRK